MTDVHAAEKLLKPDSSVRLRRENVTDAAGMAAQPATAPKYLRDSRFSIHCEHTSSVNHCEHTSSVNIHPV